VRLEQLCHCIFLCGTLHRSIQLANPFPQIVEQHQRVPRAGAQVLFGEYSLKNLLPLPFSNRLMNWKAGKSALQRGDKLYAEVRQ
jgi:hypothetical protein